MKSCVVLLALLASCDKDPGPDPTPAWRLVQQNLPGALLSVWGTSENDVWAVGSDADRSGPLGPLVLHFNGAAWERLETGEQGDLWWVFGFAGGPVYMGGAGGMILSYASSTFTRMTTPDIQTVFGIWGATPSDVWAVGGEYGGARGAFAWRLSGSSWVAEPTFPASLTANAAMWKVHGRAANDVWLVGTDGNVVYWDGQQFTASNAGTGESLFTVHANASRFVAVGGFGGGIILEHDGSGWSNVSPSGASGLVGVCLTNEGGTAVGWYGEVYKRLNGAWQADDKGFYVDQTLHSVWVDPKGGVWAAGGDVISLTNGVLLHQGDTIPEGGVQ